MAKANAFLRRLVLASLGWRAVGRCRCGNGEVLDALPKTLRSQPFGTRRKSESSLQVRRHLFQDWGRRFLTRVTPGRPFHYALPRRTAVSSAVRAPEYVDRNRRTAWKLPLSAPANGPANDRDKDRNGR